MHWVRAYCDGEVWMSARVSTEVQALNAAAEWLLCDNVIEVEVEKR